MPEDETAEAFCKRYGVKLNYMFLQDGIGPRIDRYCNKKHAYLHFKRHSSVSQLLKHMDYQEEVQKRNIKYERRLRIEKLKKIAEEKKREREQQSQSPKSILKNSISSVKLPEQPTVTVKEEGDNLLKLIETPLFEPISRNKNEDTSFRSILRHVSSLSTIKDTVKDSSRQILNHSSSQSTTLPITNLRLSIDKFLKSRVVPQPIEPLKP